MSCSTTQPSGCVSLAPKRRTPLSRLCPSHDRRWVVSRCNRAKTAQMYLHEAKQAWLLPALVEIRRDRCMPVVCLLGEPPCNPNQSSALPVIDYKRLTPSEAKETHPLPLVRLKTATSLRFTCCLNMAFT